MTIEFPELLPNDELDQLLKQLAQAAQQHPCQSPERQMALKQLVQEISTCDRLNHPLLQGKCTPSLYEEMYNEAFQKTLVEICQRIDEYKPEHYVITWVNILLKERFTEVEKHYERSKLIDSALENRDRYIPTEKR